MLHFDDTHKRFVIPKWLSLSKAVLDRELAIPRTDPFKVTESTRTSLEEDLYDFRQTPNLLKASDLMGAAFVIGEKDIAIEAADYVSKSTSSQQPSLKLAEHILNPQLPTNPIVIKTEIQIAKFKRDLRNFPKNPLLWIELARLYTIRGQVEQGRRAVVVALNLARSNRFVVRSAARFYMHLREFDAAWHCTKKALDINADPWIEATLVNAAMAMDKSPRKSIRGTPTDISDPALYHYSELIETRGMLELESGNSRRARKDFRLAWQDPSKNVITHGEWILRNTLPGMAESVNLDTSGNPEAEAWKHYSILDLTKAIMAAREWALEEPYSRHPWILGSSIFCETDRFKDAQSFAREGLVSNPDDFTLGNNLVFALLMDSKVRDAERELASSPAPQTDVQRPVRLATLGLLEFKKGNLQLGRQFYLEAIALSEKLNAHQLAARAFLNLAIAEIEAKGDRMDEFISQGMAAVGNCENSDRDPTMKLSIRRLQNAIDKDILWRITFRDEPSKSQITHRTALLPKPDV